MTTNAHPVPAAVLAHCHEAADAQAREIGRAATNYVAVERELAEREVRHAREVLAHDGLRQLGHQQYVERARAAAVIRLRHAIEAMASEEDLSSSGRIRVREARAALAAWDSLPATVQP